MQSKKDSLVESLAQISVGYCVSVFLTMILFHGRYGIAMSWNIALDASVFYTVASLIRSYMLRRLFNWRDKIRSEKNDHERRPF